MLFLPCPLWKTTSSKSSRNHLVLTSSEIYLPAHARVLPLILQVERFMLQSGGKPTGLDMTEHAKAVVPRNVRHLPTLSPRSPVLFRGVLTINRLAHLTEKAIKRLNTELYVRLRESIHTRTKLTVEGLYDAKGKPKSEMKRIRVLLHGEKSHLSVGYLTNKLVPNDLTFWSGDRQRQYEVASMDIWTYDLSRTYLFRYHTLRALQTIYEASQDTTLAVDRTPEWFAQRYADSLAHPAHDRWRRILFDEDADDTDTGSFLDEPLQEARDFPLGVLTHLPRELRVVHRTEFINILAAHIKWILADQSARQRKWIDCNKWRAWATNATQARRQVRTSDSDRLWGAPDEYDTSTPLMEDLDNRRKSSALLQRGNADSDDRYSDAEGCMPNRRRVHRTTNCAGSPGHELPKIETSISTMKKRRKIVVLSSDSEGEMPVKPLSRGRLSAASSSGQTMSRAKSKRGMAKSATSMAQLHRSHQLDENTYDSDSLSSSSVSDSDRPRRRASGVDPAIRQFCHLIPAEFCRRPVPPEDFIWECPLSGCSYSLDLLRHTENDTKAIPPEMVEDLSRPLDDERMVVAFRAVVEEHQRDHLMERGIVFESHRQTGGIPTMRWLHPQPDLPAPSKKWEDEMARRSA